MGVGRSGQTDNARDGSKQYGPKQAKMPAPDHLVHVQDVNAEKTASSPQ